MNDDIYGHLLSGLPDGLTVEAVSLGRSWTAARLSDGSVGMAAHFAGNAKSDISKLAGKPVRDAAALIMVETFRENVLRDVVPAVSRLRTENARRLGIGDYHLYDDGVIIPGGDPVPCGKEQLFAAARQMYHGDRRSAQARAVGRFFQAGQQQLRRKGKIGKNIPRRRTRDILQRVKELKKKWPPKVLRGSSRAGGAPPRIR